MNAMTTGTAKEARPASEAPSRTPSLTSTAERRVRALAPTVYCPPTRVEQCLDQAGQDLAQ